MAINSAVAVLSAQTIANGSTYFTPAYPGVSQTGYAAVLIVLAGSSSVTITQQASIAGITWYDAVDKSGAALGAVATALTTTAAGVYVQFTPVIAPYNRFKVVTAADSTVSLTAVFSENSTI